jgi:hypothetical protein
MSSPPKDCGCCSSSIPSGSSGIASTDPKGFEWALPVAWVPVLLSGSRCECRAGAPTDSAPEPVQNTVDQRSEQRRAEMSVPPVFHESPLATLTAINLREGDPPQLALSLRTTHLLI